MEKIMLEKQGRILIPKSIRNNLKLRTGEDMIIEVRNDEIILKPLKSISDFSLEFKGCIKESKTNPLELKKIWST
ncbi:AbrB/MazE/SpoVT family DNA-binding domain-containing protein [Candidatus Woesearchaeota archaeon]|nr:AbrB/MazE/SpoVT family DNA-binding domain-containing protein [Candidatus Woesearchaeota archaeon]